MYVAMLVVLACVLRQGVTIWRASRLQSVAGIDRRTLARWRTWWTERFVRAAARLERLEVRSYESTHVHGLWHLDFHQGSRKCWCRRSSA